jgi:hypothetical protein
VRHFEKRKTKLTLLPRVDFDEQQTVPRSDFGKQQTVSDGVSSMSARCQHGDS